MSQVDKTMTHPIYLFTFLGKTKPRKELGRYAYSSLTKSHITFAIPKFWC